MNSGHRMTTIPASAKISQEMRDGALKSVMEYVNQGPVSEQLDIDHKHALLNQLNALNQLNWGRLQHAAAGLETIRINAKEAIGTGENPAISHEINRSEVDRIFKRVEQIWVDSIRSQLEESLDNSGIIS